MSRYSWNNEIISVIEFLHMGREEVMRMSVCERKSMIFAHNKMMERQKEEIENERAKSKNKNKGRK